MLDWFLAHPFWSGALIGFLGALVGAASDLAYARRNYSAKLPSGGLLLIVASILNTVVGLVAMLVSLLLTGSVRLAIFTGLGVFVGFAIGFLILAGILILIGDREARTSSSTGQKTGAPGR